MKEYKTKQRDLIISVFSSHNALTAKEICEKLHFNVNKSTIYRNLEKLIKSGNILKELSKDGSKAVYRLNPTIYCNGHIHLICSCCGEIIHLSEVDSKKLDKALKKDYGFYVNDNATIISGVCENCSNK